MALLSIKEQYKKYFYEYEHMDRFHSTLLAEETLRKHLDWLKTQWVNEWRKNKSKIRKILQKHCCDDVIGIIESYYDHRCCSNVHKTLLCDGKCCVNALV